MPRPRNPALPPIDDAAVGDLLRRQDGLITRHQLREALATDTDIARMLRRRELVRVGRGVFVNHTGLLTPLQREWAAVLEIPGSALVDDSALQAARRRPGRRETLPDEPGRVLDLGVPAHAHPAGRAGVRVRHVVDLQEQVRWGARPPRMKVELAALRVAGRAPSDVDAVAVLTGVIGDRLTTVARLQAVLHDLPKARRRRWLGAVLADLAEGTCSVLEHGYLVRVERPHALPRPSRQTSRRTASGSEYRDVEYADFGVVVELDGRAFHESADDRDRDYERELDDQVAGMETVRLGWGQVYRRSCRTAGKVGVVLQRHGWTGSVERCGAECQLAS